MVRVDDLIEPGEELSFLPIPLRPPSNKGRRSPDNRASPSSLCYCGCRAWKLPRCGEGAGRSGICHQPTYPGSGRRNRGGSFHSPSRRRQSHSCRPEVPRPRAQSHQTGRSCGDRRGGIWARRIRRRAHRHIHVARIGFPRRPAWRLCGGESRRSPGSRRGRAERSYCCDSTAPNGCSVPDRRAGRRPMR